MFWGTGGLFAGSAICTPESRSVSSWHVGERLHPCYAAKTFAADPSAGVVQVATNCGPEAAREVYCHRGPSVSGSVCTPVTSAGVTLLEEFGVCRRRDVLCDWAFFAASCSSVAEMNPRGSRREPRSNQIVQRLECFECTRTKHELSNPARRRGRAQGFDPVGSSKSGDHLGGSAVCQTAPHKRGYLALWLGM